ncbi:MAG: LamG-like jellyroll fold domain-containing protein [Elusimicrobiota bacterium]
MTGPGTARAADTDCVEPPSGRVAWWRAEGDASDFTGSYDGSLENGTSFSSGKVGDAFSFDGANDRMAGHELLLTAANTFTVEFWAYPAQTRNPTPESVSGTAGTSGQRYAMAPGHGGSQDAGAGISVGTNGISVFEHGASYLPSLLVYDAPLSEWTHVAVVYENKQPRLYVGGTLVKTGLASQRRTVYASGVLGDTSSYGPFAGLLDEVSVYARALSQAEIQAIASAGGAGKCAPETTAPRFETPEVSADGTTFIDPGTALETTADITARITVQDAESGLVDPEDTIQPIPGTVGLWHFDEGAGTLAMEDSGKAPAAALAGGTSWSLSGIGKSLRFDGSDDRATTMGLLTTAPNSFTIELWASPSTSRDPTSEANSGISGTGGQRYAIGPGHGGSQDAGAGISVGTNGIAVFEHGSSYLPSPLVYDAPIVGWTHIAVVYDDKRPSLYVNGAFVKTGLASNRRDVFPSGYFGDYSGYGPYMGLLDEVRVLAYPATAQQIAEHYLKQSAAYSARYSTDGGESWRRVPAAKLSLSLAAGAASATDPHYLTAAGLALAPSPEPGINRIEFMAADVAGNTASFSYDILTPPPDTAPPDLSDPGVSADGASFLDPATALPGRDGISARITVQDSGSGLPPDAGALFPEIEGASALWHLEEASGEAVEDASGNGNHGTLVNFPARVEGRHGRGLSFNGADQAVHVPDSAGLTPAYELTVEFWYKPNGTDAWLSKGNGANDMAVNEWLIHSCGDGSAGSMLYVNVGGSWRTSPCTTGTVPGEWNHMAWTYDGNQAAAYRNGVLTGVSTWGFASTPIHDGDGVVAIGYDARYPIGTAGRMMNGVIDEIRILNAALTEEQVLREYESEPGFSARVSVDGGQGWTEVPSSYISLNPLSPGASENDPHRLTVSGLNLAPSAGPDTNRIELTASDLDGNRRSYAFNILTPPPPAGPFIDDDFSAGVLDASKWISAKFGSGTADVSDGVLRLRTAGTSSRWRAISLYSKEVFQATGVYYLDLDWKPGTKASSAGQSPSIYFRDVGAIRDGTYQSPSSRYVRLDLGTQGDYGQQRTSLTLYGMGASSSQSSLKSVALDPPIAADPDPSAVFRHIRIALDFDNKTLSLYLDGQAIMSGVDLTKDSSGNSIDFLPSIRDFHVELYGGAQFYSSPLTESFDNVLLEGPPQLRGLSPGSGSAGRQATLTGRGFGVEQGNGAVTIGGVPMQIASWTDLQIVGAVPPGLPLGRQDLVITADDGRASRPWLFTATERHAELFSESFPDGALDDGKWSSEIFSSAYIKVDQGRLRLETAGGSNRWRAASVLTKRVFKKGGVYHLNLDWKPGTKASSAGYVPGIYFRDAAADREGTYNYPSNRYIQLELGTNNDMGELRTVMTLYGKGTVSPHTLKRVTLASPVLAEPNAAATFRNIHIALDFDAKTLSLELDGRAVMTDVDLTRDSNGNPAEILSAFEDFQLELYGGSQYYSSPLVESFDNVLLEGPPQLLSMSRASGPPGTELVLEGHGFGDAQGNGSVTLDAAPLTVASWTDTSITAVVPPGTPEGRADIAVADHAGHSTVKWLFTVTEELAELHADDFSGESLDGVKWSSVYTGSAAAEVEEGRLRLKTINPNNNWRGVSVFPRRAFDKAGVYHVNLEWKPGTKASSAGRIPGIFFRDAAGSRDASLLYPMDRYIRLDLGSSGDNGQKRTVLRLYGRGTGSEYTLRTVTLPTPVLADPADAAAFHLIHIGLDLDALTFTMEMDGREIMTGVDLTRDYNGNPVDFLSAIGDFHLELYGGGQYYTSSLVESFDNVRVDGNSQIQSVSRGSGAPNTELAVTGSGFGDAQGSGYFRLGAHDLSVLSWSGTSILARVPPGTPEGVYDVTIKPDTGPEMGGFRFTVTPPGRVLVYDDFEGPALDGNVWRTAEYWTASAEIVDGSLSLKAGGACCGYRGVAAYPVPQLRQQGVYHLNLDWKPGRKSDGNGRIPAIFLRAVGASRNSSYQSPDERYIRLDLGLNNDTGSTRTKLNLYGQGAPGATLSTIKTVTLDSPILTAPDQNAVFHQVHIAFDADNKTFSLDLDGQPVMSDVDLTHDSGGTPIGFLDKIGNFQMELYGGSQYSNSSLVETFDNVILEGPPQLHSISRGSGAWGTALTLRGIGFGDSQGSGFVSLGGNNLPVLIWSDGAVAVSIPQGTALGPQALVLKGDIGPELGGFKFTVTDPLPMLLADDFEGGGLDADAWKTVEPGSTSVGVSSGSLEIRAAGPCCSYRGVAAYGSPMFLPGGVYHLNLDWKPGHKNDGNGRIPAIYFRAVATSRDYNFQDPMERFIRLDLGTASDTGSFRTELSLYGRGTSTLHLLKKVPISLLLPTAPSPDATTHQIHIALDIDNKTLSMDLDGQPMMTDVDLTHDSGGTAISFLDKLGIFQLEFYGGSQYGTSSLVEAFDNVVMEGPPQLHAASRGSGPAGTELTLTGNGFGETRGSGYVRLGGNDLTVLSWSNDALLVRVPEGTPLGPQELAVKVALGPEVGGFRFTVTPRLPVLLSDDFEAGVLDGSVWRKVEAGGTVVEVSDGSLDLKTARSCCQYRGVAAYGRPLLRGKGVYHLNLNWLPGRKDDGNGRIPSIYFRAVAASRDYNFQDPTERFIRLDLGTASDTGSFRTELSLYGRGTSTIHLLKKVPISLLLPTAPSPDATVHQIHIALDFDDKTFSFDLDGRAMMTGVDLTRDSNGNPVGFLDKIGEFQLELYGGSQYATSSLVETFDNVLLEGPPQLRSVRPDIGPPGTQVEITGVGFGDSQGTGKVSLGAGLLSVASWSDTAITASLPPGTPAGTGNLSVVTDAGQASRGWLLTATGALLTVLEDAFEGAALDASKWETMTFGSASVQVADGELKFNLDGPCCQWRGAAAYSKSQFNQQGVYHFSLDWSPDTKTDANGLAPGIYFRSPDSGRHGTYQSPNDRYLRLDLGYSGDTGPRRTEMTLYGRGEPNTTQQTLKKKTLEIPIPTVDDPDVSSRQVHIALDFENKTFSLDIDGEAIMTNVDLTKNSDGGTIGFLGTWTDFHMEIFGGAQKNTSAMIESFDNASLRLADISIPVAQITSHTENDFVSGLVTVTGTAMDEGGISGTEFFIDGEGQGAAEPPEFSFAWDTLARDGEEPLYPDGPHAVYLQARDQVGNVGASPAVSLKVDNTPPVTSLSPAPNGSNGWYRSPMPNLTLSAADGSGSGAGEVRFTLDEDPETVSTGASAQPAVPEGIHVLSYFAVDRLGNQETAKTTTLNIDLQAPTLPENPRTTLVVERRADLAWDASADAEGPAPSGTALYRVSRRVYDGGTGFSVIADTPTLAYSNTTGLVLGETYEYQVRAVDAAGNASAPAELTVFVPDLTPPELSDVSATLSEDETRIDVAWDTNELATGQVAMGTDPWVYTTTTPATVDYQDIEHLGRGHLTAVEGLEPHTTYYFRAFSIDAFGNQSSSEEFTIITDTHPPTLAITGPEAGANTSTAVTIEFTVTDDLTPEGSIEVKDDQGHDAPPFTFTEEGQKTVTLTATDAAGNSASASVTFTIDKTGPSRIADLNVTVQRPASAEADLAWTSPSDALSAVAGYALKSHSEPLDDSNWDDAAPHAAPSPSEPGTEESHTVTDLPEDVAYLAIRSQDEVGNLSPVSNSVLYDPVPPEAAITAPAPGTVLTRPSTATATASDSQGIARVDFLVDGEAAGTDAAAPYEFYFDIRDFLDGTHSLMARALDSFGNAVEATVPVTISYAPPPAPAILSPEEGFLTATAVIDVSGTAEPGNTVTVFVDGSAAGSASVQGDGTFVVLGISLPADGAVALTARLSDSRGTSAPSAAVNGTLDTAAPGPPVQPVAASLTGGRIRLDWGLPEGETPAAYKVYRSNQEAALTEGATPPPSLLVHQGPDTSYTDAPPHDGLFFYGAVSLDAASNASGLSEIAPGVSDRATPSASIRLTQSTPPLGPGEHPLELTLSEALTLPPALTITPQGQDAVTIEIEQTTTLVWVGTLTVTPSMATGTAEFGFQGQDFAGNVGTALTSGQSAGIDTRGPLGAIAFPAAVSSGDFPLSLSLDEPAAGVPTLSFTPSGRAAVPVALSASGPDNRDWTGSVAVDETTGDGPADFNYSAEDALGNLSATLSGGAAQFIIDTVPPGPPTLVQAVAGQGGAIGISWEAPDAGEMPSSYLVFRDGAQLSPAVTPSPDGSGDYTDMPSDGAHDYEVASVDLAGNRTKSAAVSATTDATPPDAPTDLAAQLDTSVPGTPRVGLSFKASADSEGFNVYRSLTPIGSTAGMTPVLAAQAAGPPDAQGFRGLADIPVQDDTYFYAVTALDHAGNESPASNGSAGVLFDKTPPTAVTDLRVVASTPTSTLTLFWTAPSDGLAGVHSYRIRYGATAALTPAAWEDAAEIQQSIVPKAPGSAESLAITSLPLDHHLYFFNIRTLDSVGNLASLSNPVAFSSIPPGLTIWSPAEGAVISRPVTISAGATDAVGVSDFSFAVDGETLASPQSSPHFRWDTLPYPDGAHTLGVTAFNTFGFSSTVDRPVVLSYVPPPAPMIQSPHSPFQSLTGAVDLSGSAEAHIRVRLYLDGIALESDTFADAYGRFSFPDIGVPAGTHVFSVFAVDRSTSAASNAVTVAYSEDLPGQPEQLQAQSQPAGKVSLAWDEPDSGADVGYYRLYRSTSPLSLASGGTPPPAHRLPPMISGTSHVDRPSVDGLYYYAVSASDFAGREGVISSTIAALSDRAAPTAVISVGSSPPLGVGSTPVVLDLSESLQSAPLLTITPHDSFPIPIVLSAQTPTEWTGTLHIQSFNPSGTAVFAFAGVDLVGNQGQTISSGGTVEILTQGPEGELSLTPASPYQAGTVVQIALALSTTPAQPPSLGLLTPAGDSVPVSLSGSTTSYAGSFTVTTEMGDGTGGFAYSAADSLGNVGQTLTGTTFYFIDTTPPDPPRFMTATPRPAGAVQLNWSSPVGEEAARYNLYRADDLIFSKGGLTPAQTEILPNPDHSGSFTDHPPAEQAYYYAVTAMDAAGNEGNVSGSARADSVSTPPPPPAGLTASINAFGQIELSWVSGGGSTSRFLLYRSTRPLPSLSGLTPIPAASPYVDVLTRNGTYYYRATALDIAGNESPPSDETHANYNGAPPAITVLGVEDGRFYRTDVSPVFYAEDPNLVPSSVSATVDEESFVSGSTVSAEGEHAMTVFAANTGGLTASEDLRFTIDKTPPAISVTEVAQGATYYAAVHATFGAADANLMSVAAVLDGEAYSSGSSIATAGRHTLVVTAQDKAGNSAESTLAFRLMTPPPAPLDMAVQVSSRGAALSWTAPPYAETLSGYNVYRNGVRLNQTPIPQTSFEDFAFPRDQGFHAYRVAGLDGLRQEGPSSTATIVPVEVLLGPSGIAGGDESMRLTRGYFDRIVLALTRPDSDPVNALFGPAAIELPDISGATLSDCETGWTFFGGGQSRDLSTVCAIPPELPNPALVRVRLVQGSEPGTSVTRILELPAAVREPPSAGLTLLPGTFSPNAHTQVTVRLSNQGSAALIVPAGALKLRLKTQAGMVLSEASSEAVLSVPAGQAAAFDPLALATPESIAIDSLLDLEAVVSGMAGEGGLAGPGLANSITVLVSSVSLHATLRHDRDVYDQGQAITFTGYASDLDGNPLPDSQVKVGIAIRDFTRIYFATTSAAADLTGRYPYFVDFHPSAGEAGVYSAWAVDPGIFATPVMSTFAIVGMAITPAQPEATLAKGTTYLFEVGVANTGETPVTPTDVTFSLLDSQAEGLVGLDLASSTLLSPIEPGTEAKLKLRAWGDAEAPGSVSFLMQVRESHGFERTAQVRLYLVPSQVYPRVQPQSFVVSLAAGQSKNLTSVISNVGTQVWRGVSLGPPTASWIHIHSETEIGDLAPGESFSVSLSVNPPEDLPSGTHNERISVDSANLDSFPLGVGVILTSSREGDITFHIIDSNSATRAGVKGATVTLTSLDVPGLSFNLPADLNGVATFTQIPAGKFQWQIAAPGFHTSQGMAEAIPGIPETIEYVLPRSFVSTTFTVTPTLIKDEYDVKLEVTYETDVPAPVVTVEPNLLEIPLNAGETAYGQLRLTNHGLVKAHDLRFDIKSDTDTTIQFMQDLIPELLPGQSVDVPYRIELAHASCHWVTMVLWYTYHCIAGSWVSVPGPSVTFGVGDSCGGGGGGGGRRYWGGGGCCGGGQWRGGYVPDLGGARPAPTSCGEFGLGLDDLGKLLKKAGKRALRSMPPSVSIPIALSFGCKLGADGTDPTSGNMNLTFRDLNVSIPKYGFSLDFAHFYNTHNLDATGSLGKGWRHSFEGSLRTVRSVEGYINDSRREIFVMDSTRTFVIAQTPGGDVWQFDRNDDGTFSPPDLAQKPDGSYSLAIPEGELLYDSAGRLTKIADSSGDSVGLQYDPSGRLDNVVDDTGRTLYTLQHDLEGRLRSVTDFADRSAEFVFTDGRLTSLTNLQGDHSFVYGGPTGDLVTEMTDPRGLRTSWDYESPPDIKALGKATAAGAYAHAIYTLPLTPSGAVDTALFEQWYGVDVATPLAKASSETISSAERRSIREFSGGSASMTAGIPSADYVINKSEVGGSQGFQSLDLQMDDAMGNGKAIVQTPMGATAELILGHTPAGTMVRGVRAPGNPDLAVQYNSSGSVTSMSDSLGREANFFYDERGRLTAASNSAGVSAQASYDADDNVTSVTDPMGHKVRFEYDSQGRMTRLNRPDGTTQVLGYGPTGSWTSLQDAMGEVTARSFDSDGNLASITTPMSRTTGFTRDGLGRIASITSPSGRVRHMTRNEFGSITDIRESNGATTRFTYEPGCVSCETLPTFLTSSIQDPNGNTTTFDYDAEGKYRGMTSPSGNVTRVSYDSAGRITQLTDPDGYTSLYSYDVAGRRLSSSFADTTFTQSYNEAGTLATLEDEQSKTQFSYNEVNRPVHITETNKAASLQVNLGYSYDKNGGMTSMVTPWGIYQYEYDVMGRMVSLESPLGQTVTFSYDALSRKKTTLLSNGITVSYDYDADSRMTGIETRRNGASVLSFAYGYDVSGNRTSMTDFRGAHEYSYDVVGRLTRASHPPDTMVEALEEAFSYDPGGNRTSGPRSSSSLYDTENALTSDARYDYAYDKRGDRVSRTSKADGSVVTYAWDARNRLTRISDGKTGRISEFTYDSMSRRIRKRVTLGALSKTVDYVYDGLSIVAMQVTQDSGGTPSIDIFYVTYGRSHDEPLILHHPDGDYFLHTDALGSVVALSDSDGNIVERVEYESYGKPTFIDAVSGSTRSVSSVGDPFTYVGREYEEDSGLIYMRARYYDAELGRFISKDPAFASTNLYAYAESDPVNHKDTSGLYIAVGDSSLWDAGEALTAEKRKYAGKNNAASAALGDVITARGGDDGAYVDTPVQSMAKDSIGQTLGHDASPTELRNLDHFLNNSGAMGLAAENALPGLKTLSGIVTGLVAIPITGAYSYTKCYDQIYGTSIHKGLSGGRHNSNAPNASPASYEEIAAGLMGIGHGFRDLWR